MPIALELIVEKRDTSGVMILKMQQWVCFVILAALLVNLLGSGCAGTPARVPGLSIASLEEGTLNPLFVQTDNPNYLWEAVVDVIDNYFPVFHERPIRSSEQNLSNGSTTIIRTEGRLDTEPVIAAGVLEPWKSNSITLSQRVEATFQTIRRKAVVRVVPTEKGYQVYLAVYNEIENLPNPMNSAYSGGNLAFSDSLSQLDFDGATDPQVGGWIPLGRNTELEQHILQELAWRLNNPPDLANPKEPPPPLVP